ncbi:MAG: sugar phosphate isomerase/epimerase [Planctomycetia bacterium]|nr:sugar phosphate isomerase/epimerase [Planctomycetia bacterium]
MPGHDDIRIGTLIRAKDAPLTIRSILPHGFECFEIAFGGQVGDVDLGRLAGEVRSELARGGDTAIISAVGVYGNPLTDEETRASWSKLIRNAGNFGCKLVCGFVGRVVDRPIPESIPRFKEVFGPLASEAADHGVRLAFENCDMGGTWDRGDWNIAHASTAWEMMIDAVPNEAWGLEWEPCHQMVSLVDPLPQLRKWASKVYHVHGKDASIYWDVIRESGIRSGRTYVEHRTPGFGDTNWTDVISILRQAGYRGTIDIEGWHDPIYRDDLEMTGQVHALNYLRRCRGGAYVPNPPGYP